MYITKTSNNAAHTTKEGSKFSPYKEINVSEFVSSFLNSKKTIIENELLRIVEMTAAHCSKADIDESLDNIERQYYRAVSVANHNAKNFCYYRNRIDLEKANMYLTGDNVDKMALTYFFDNIKSSIFDELTKE